MCPAYFPLCLHPDVLRNISPTPFFNSEVFIYQVLFWTLGIHKKLDESPLFNSSALYSSEKYILAAFYSSEEREIMSKNNEFVEKK